MASIPPATYRLDSGARAVHGPPGLPIEAPTDSRPASQGLSTLGGGVLSRSVLRAKSRPPFLSCIESLPLPYCPIELSLGPDQGLPCLTIPDFPAPPIPCP